MARERGQATVEVVAVLPLVLLALLAAAQGLIAAWAAVEAADAARAGARAALLGGDAARTARAALPPSLRAGRGDRPRPRRAVSASTVVAPPGWGGAVRVAGEAG